MQYPISTGQAAHFLGTTEPRLADLVRKGKIQPYPPIAAGRRLWEIHHILDAGACLGLDPDELRRRLVTESTRVA
jgi:hypothetical protein